MRMVTEEHFFCFLYMVNCKIFTKQHLPENKTQSGYAEEFSRRGNPLWLPNKLMVALYPGTHKGYPYKKHPCDFACLSADRCLKCPPLNLYFDTLLHANDANRKLGLKVSLSVLFHSVNIV